MKKDEFTIKPRMQSELKERGFDSKKGEFILFYDGRKVYKSKQPARYERLWNRLQKELGVKSIFSDPDEGQKSSSSGESAEKLGGRTKMRTNIKGAKICGICGNLIQKPTTAQKYHKGECAREAGRRNYKKRKQKMKRKMKQQQKQQIPTNKGKKNLDKFVSKKEYDKVCKELENKNELAQYQRQVSVLQQREIAELQEVNETWTRIERLRNQKREIIQRMNNNNQEREDQQQ